MRCRVYIPPLTVEQQKMVEANMGLVFQTAYKFPTCQLYDRDDVVQAASLGLMEAVRNFDPSLGFKFSSFAVRCMVNTINTLSITERNRRKKVGVKNSLSTLVGEIELEKLLIDLTADDPVEHAANKENVAFLKRHIQHLPIRTQKVLKGRYFEDKTLAQLGKELNLAKERIRQIQADAISKLKRATRIKIT